jgi:hypothetical protein
MTAQFKAMGESARIGTPLGLLDTYSVIWLNEPIFGHLAE